MKRRTFIAGLGSVAAWHLAARAQQIDRVRRIGVLMNLASEDQEGRARIAAFRQGLLEFGWTAGLNVRIDDRWAANDADRYRRYAAELIELAPDVILASGNPATAALQRISRKGT